MMQFSELLIFIETNSGVEFCNKILSYNLGYKCTVIKSRDHCFFPLFGHIQVDLAVLQQQHLERAEPPCLFASAYILTFLQ